MTTSIIITICILLLLAYIFDVSAPRTKIPSVILLLVLGWAVKQGIDFFEIRVPGLTPALPILGTIGLILIVLEGSLELELDRAKLPAIGKTAVIALVPMLLFSFGLATLFRYFGDVSLKVGLANAIPLSIISSAIAIPSAQNLISKNKEFITYESSLSDIFGVIFFNFITLNEYIGANTVGSFILDILIILVVTFIATLGLSFLLSKIKHHVKFLPIILIIVLIYTFSKIYHLPALVFIMSFGLFLKNIDKLKANIYIQKMQPDILTKEAHKFRELTTELAFLIRALFFLLFGYLIEAKELFNSETILWAIGICFGIFSIRYTFLKLFSLPIKPILYIAPRGLITILLFLSIPINQTFGLVNNSLVLQVIILTALAMMVGFMTKPEDTAENNVRKS